LPRFEAEHVDPPRCWITVGDGGTRGIGKSSRIVHPAECIHCVECESHPAGGNADSHIEPRVAAKRNRVGVIDERPADGADEKTAAQAAPETQIRPGGGHRPRNRLQLVAVELATLGNYTLTSEVRKNERATRSRQTASELQPAV